jgi:hypothetical protein
MPLAAISAASLNASIRPSGFATLRPTMSKALPLAHVATGTGRPPCSVTPLSKPISFIAICPWSWIHRDHRVEVAAARGQEHGVGRQRPARVDPFLPRAFDRRCDDVDLLAADRSAIAPRAD